jgi:hypothetical protein
MKGIFRILTISFALLLTGCGGGSGGSGDSGGSTACPTITLAKGFSLSPQGFPMDYNRLPEFFTEIKGLGDSAVMWNGSWRDDAINGSDAGAIPAAAKLVLDNASSYCYTPVVVFGWRSGATLYIRVPSNPTNNWTNTEARLLFKDMLVSFATSNRPPYIFLGNENDFYYEQNQADYENWLSFYNQAYDAIKAASPSTLVGPVFNYEHIAGVGVLNGWTTDYWQALDSHNINKVDIVGITVYPFLSYASAKSVPVNYLNSLFSRIGSKPVAITETGWPAENLGGLNPLWNTSEQEQIDYISSLFSAMTGKDVRFVNWLFLHAMQNDGSTGWKLFGSVSLRNSSGGKRSAYDVWAAR